MKNNIILLAEHRILKRGFSSITPQMYYEEIKKFSPDDIALIALSEPGEWAPKVNALWEKNHFTVEKTLEIVEKIISENPEMVEKLESEPAVFGYFCGNVMKESRGLADPKIVTKLLKEKLGIGN